MDSKYRRWLEINIWDAEQESPTLKEKHIKDIQDYFKYICEKFPYLEASYEEYFNETDIEKLKKGLKSVQSFFSTFSEDAHNYLYRLSLIEEKEKK